MAFRNRPVNGCPPKSSAPGTYWPVSTAHSPARRYEHILSSPNLTQPPTFPFPETHWYPLQTTRTNMFPKPPILKFLRACTYSELLCYNEKGKELQTMSRNPHKTRRQRAPQRTPVRAPYPLEEK